MATSDNVLADLYEASQNNALTVMVNEFYTFMGDKYIEYINQSEKYQVKQKQTDDNGQETETIHDQTFIEYFLFKLYFDYGVKRKMITDNIALLFYVKSLKGYKSTSKITMLCRHLMIDLRYMRIISLGIPKAMKLDDFVAKYKINQEDAASNCFVTEDGQGNVNGNISKYRIYRFPEGTMITYNPSLKKYNINAVELNVDNTEEQDDVEDAKDKVDENITEQIQTNISQQFEKLDKNFEYSTRKVVGTGRFSSIKTFMEMFNENNAIANTKLEDIPEDLVKDRVLVFNIEHPENRIISNQLRNFNTLCAVYTFKSEDVCKSEYESILTMENPTQNIETIRTAFVNLSNKMVTQMHVTEYKKLLQDANVIINLHLPEIVRSFERKNEAGESEMITIESVSMNQLKNIVENRPKTFQGYIIYGVGGERTKIMNTKYKEMKQLKGNKPIVIEQWNTKNLFYLYWRLVKQQTLQQFIQEFDMTGGWSYNQLFYWFATMARNYSMHLFKVYHHTFVKKDLAKSDIPYSMKPLCGDLHKMYMANKCPISQTMVEQFIWQQPAGKIFWRIFSNK
jgi:hypothetical protein